MGALLNRISRTPLAPADSSSVNAAVVAAARIICCRPNPWRLCGLETATHQCCAAEWSWHPRADPHSHQVLPLSCSALENFECDILISTSARLAFFRSMILQDAGPRTWNVALKSQYRPSCTSYRFNCLPCTGPRTFERSWKGTSMHCAPEKLLVVSRLMAMQLGGPLHVAALTRGTAHT